MEKTVKYKLLLLFSLVAAILGFMVLMFFQVKPGAELEIYNASFESEFVKEVRSFIPLKTHSTSFSVLKRYRQLIDEIKTESLLHKIKDDEMRRTEKEVNTAYITYVLNVSRNLRRSGEWNRDIMRSLKYNNELMLGNKYCPQDRKSQMRQNVDLAEKYFEAVDLIDRSFTYVSVEDSKTKIMLALSLLEFTPFESNKNLMEQLKNVNRNLFDAHLKTTYTQVNNNLRSETESSIERAQQIMDFFVSTINDVYMLNPDDYTDLFHSEKKRIEEIMEKVMLRDLKKKIGVVDEQIF